MKLTEVWPVFVKYRTKGLILDTNVLLLLFAGSAGAKVLTTFKPTRNHAFTLRDFSLLLRIVTWFGKIITTPHILTEVSNHSDRLADEYRLRFCHQIEIFARRCREESRPSSDLCGQEEFRKFGLADAAISAIAPGEYLVLTVDAPLASFLRGKGVDVINFNDLRLFNWTW